MDKIFLNGRGQLYRAAEKKAEGDSYIPHVSERFTAFVEETPRKMEEVLTDFEEEKKLSGRGVTLRVARDADKRAKSGD